MIAIGLAGKRTSGLGKQPGQHDVLLQVTRLLQCIGGAQVNLALGVHIQKVLQGFVQCPDLGLVRATLAATLNGIPQRPAQFNPGYTDRVTLPGGLYIQ
jgi:hypothetical protein